MRGSHWTYMYSCSPSETSNCENIFHKGMVLRFWWNSQEMVPVVCSLDPQIFRASIQEYHVELGTPFQGSHWCLIYSRSTTKLTTQKIIRDRVKIIGIIFGMDATASREPTWDQASQIQHEMFAAVQSNQRLAVQLCFYSGFRELKASRFCHSATELQNLMSKVRCKGALVLFWY